MFCRLCKGRVNFKFIHALWKTSTTPCNSFSTYLGNSVVLLPAPVGPPGPGRPRVGGLELGGGEGALVLLLELLGQQRVVDVLDRDGGQDVRHQRGLGRRRRGGQPVSGGKKRFLV